MTDICDTLFEITYGLSGEKKIRDDWKNIPPDITHTQEFQIVDIINRYLAQYQLSYRIERVMKDYQDNRWSPVDATCYMLNKTTLRKVDDMIIKIDFEWKQKNAFVENKCPDHWSSANFLYRKVSKPIYSNTDIYILYDNNINFPKIIWTTFGIIRSIGYDNKNRNRENRFYEISKEQYEQLSYGYVSLMNYISNFKPERTWFS